MDNQSGPTDANAAPGRPLEVLELRILNDRGNTAVDRPRQADSRARPLRRRAEIMLRPARVRIRRRKPWVRLRRRLLGWNVRLVTGKLPNLRSGQQFRYGAHTARIAGGAGRWQRPLWKRPSNGTGHRQTGQTANPVKPLWFGPMRFGPRERADAILVADDLGDWGMSPASANIARRRGEQKRADTLPFASNTQQGGSKSATSDQITNSPSMSSEHADQDREYRRLGCSDVSAIASVAVRLLSFHSATAAGDVHSSTSMPEDGGKREALVGAFMHTLWISVWKQQRRSSPVCRRRSAKAQTRADFCFAYPGRGRRHEDCGVTSERTF